MIITALPFIPPGAWPFLTQLFYTWQNLSTLCSQIIHYFFLLFSVIAEHYGSAGLMLDVFVEEMLNLSSSTNQSLVAAPNRNSTEDQAHMIPHGIVYSQLMNNVTISRHKTKKENDITADGLSTRPCNLSLYFDLQRGKRNETRVVRLKNLCGSEGVEPRAGYE